MAEEEEEAGKEEEEEEEVVEVGCRGVVEGERLQQEGSERGRRWEEEDEESKRRGEQGQIVFGSQSVREGTASGGQRSVDPLQCLGGEEEAERRMGGWAGD